ncbi:MAG: hypothetical protein JST54_21600 [Deltaproteobacteria bacterium]|nr:hypothetical protein [Deltaproteobacteria bacterium]
MAGRINNPNAGAAFWPWSANVREKIVERAQLIDRKKTKKKGGDPKNPPLASAALLEFMGPGHTSEELRFPAPVSPRAGEPRTAEESALPALEGMLDRGSDAANQGIAKEIQRLGVPADRMERLRGLLQREAGMLQVMGRLSTDLAEIHRRIRDENKGKGY